MGLSSAELVALALLALAVVLLLVVIVRAVQQGGAGWLKAKYFESPQEIWERSSGNRMDAQAELALRRTRERLANRGNQGETRINDNFWAARILRFAVLEAPAETPENRNAAVAEIRMHQNNILEEILTRNHTNRDAPEGGYAAMYILDNMLQFTGFQPDFDEQPTFDELPFFRTKFEEAKKVTREDLKNEAIGATDTRGKAAETYLSLSQNHTNDSENVHDTGVTAATRAIVRALESDPHTKGGANEVTLENIANEFEVNSDLYSRDPRTGRSRPEITNKYVLPLITDMRAGSRKRGVAAAGGLDDIQVIRLVWSRSAHPANAGNKQALRQALYDALADSWKVGFDNGSMVCLQGRVTRMLGSLALLDFDRDTWNISTQEETKNEIFESSKGVIKRVALELTHDPSDDIQAAAWEILLGDDPHAEENYARHAKQGLPTEAAGVAVAETVTAAMQAGAKKKAAEINLRNPGAVTPRNLEGILDDLRYVL
jgi:hypothetical protein